MRQSTRPEFNGKMTEISLENVKSWTLSVAQRASRQATSQSGRFVNSTQNAGQSLQNAFQNGKVWMILVRLLQDLLDKQWVLDQP